VVFSVREADRLYERAIAEAWRELEARLRRLSAANPGRRYRLVSVSYDPLPGESVIEELPDRPKSSRPDAVEASVRLRATYAVE